MRYSFLPKSTRWLMPALIVFLSILVTQPAAAQQHVEKVKLLASDGAQYDRFGSSVSVSGDVALIGAVGDDDNGIKTGSTYLFRHDPVSDTWNEEAKLLPSDGQADDQFGFSTFLAGDVALIGAWKNGTTGAAYVFRYDPGSATWAEEAKLAPSDDTSSFGCAVSLSGDVALIGAMSDSEPFPGVYAAGAAYVFRRDPVTGTWNEEAKLLLANRESEDYFGNAVSLDGNIALIAANSRDSFNIDNAGAAYIFRYDPVTLSWNEEAFLTANDPADNDWFGMDVILSGDVALIGATGTDDLGSNSGSTYVFRYDHGYKTWTQESKLLASEGADGDGFGSRLALSGNSALISAMGDDDAGVDSGSVYVISYDSASKMWIERGKLLAGDGAPEDRFGYDVALSGDTALIGAIGNDDFGDSSGSAYIYDAYFPLQLDIKCNGGDHNVIVDSSEDVTLTIDVQAYDHEGESLDVWVIAARVNKGRYYSYGYLGSPSWSSGLGNVYFSGGLSDTTGTVLDRTIPPGIYTAVLLVEAVPDGSLDLGDLVDYDAVTFIVM